MLAKFSDNIHCQMFCISYDILLQSDVCVRKTKQNKTKEKKKNCVPVEKMKNKTRNNKKKKK